VLVTGVAKVEKVEHTSVDIIDLISPGVIRMQSHKIINLVSPVTVKTKSEDIIDLVSPASIKCKSPILLTPISPLIHHSQLKVPSTSDDEVEVVTHLSPISNISHNVETHSFTNWELAMQSIYEEEEALGHKWVKGASKISKNSGEL
jgi:hypothetical protein